MLVLGDRFYGTAETIAACAARGWDYRLRLKGNLRVFAQDGSVVPAAHLAGTQPSLTGVELTAKRAATKALSTTPAMTSPGSSPCPTRRPTPDSASL